MARNVFYRDFSGAKAAVLIGLIGVSVLLGQSRAGEQMAADLSQIDQQVQPIHTGVTGVFVIKARFFVPCDEDKDPGIAL